MTSTEECRSSTEFCRAACVVTCVLANMKEVASVGAALGNVHPSSPHLDSICSLKSPLHYIGTHPRTGHCQ